MLVLITILLATSAALIIGADMVDLRAKKKVNFNSVEKYFNKQ